MKGIRTFSGVCTRTNDLITGSLSILSLTMSLSNYSSKIDRFSKGEPGPKARGDLFGRGHVGGRNVQASNCWDRCP